MRQLDLLILHARLHVEDEPHRGGGIRWNELPKRARLEVIDHLAELLRAKAEASAAVHDVEVGDE